MSEILKVLKGTKDILPQDINMWQFVERTADNVFSRYGFKEIRTPIIEATELFSRGVGETTDIVNKEMYTFEISDRSITLRPENTAGVVRAYIENGMSRLSAPTKLWYKGPMFRYERPQAGRQRQFHQIGVEMFGVEHPSADAEIILMAVNFLLHLGLKNLEVEINSLGCPACREKYKWKLKEAIRPYLNYLCEDCQVRFEKNPLRILDCKNEDCQYIYEKEEVQDVIIGNFLCEDCQKHYDEVKMYLDKMNVKYNENKFLVRGLDYYNRTVFEIKSNNLGSQNAVCGGGRYDNLVQQLGGTPTPAIGFAMGEERLISLLNRRKPTKLDAYIVSNFKTDAFVFAEELRGEGLSVEFEHGDKKFVKQLEKAAKVAKYALIMGEDEMLEHAVSIKNLDTGKQITVSRTDCVKMLEL